LRQSTPRSSRRRRSRRCSRRARSIRIARNDLSKRNKPLVNWRAWFNKTDSSMRVGVERADATMKNQDGMAKARHLGGARRSSSSVRRSGDEHKAGEGSPQTGVSRLEGRSVSGPRKSDEMSCQEGTKPRATTPEPSLRPADAVRVSPPPNVRRCAKRSWSTSGGQLNPGEPFKPFVTQ